MANQTEEYIVQYFLSGQATLHTAKFDDLASVRPK